MKKEMVILFLSFFQVWPITDYEVPEINTYSQSLVDKHRTEFPNERQLQQVQYILSPQYLLIL